MTRDQMINMFILLGGEPVAVPGVYPAVRKIGTQLVASASIDINGVARSHVTAVYAGVSHAEWDLILTDHMYPLLCEVMK